MATTNSDRQLVALVLVLLGAAILLPTLLMGFGMMGYGSMMGGTWGGGMWGTGGTAPAWVVLVGFLTQLLFLAAVVVAGYLVYRAISRAPGEDRALAELRAAYARGDLTDEEYETRKEALERDR